MFFGSHTEADILRSLPFTADSANCHHPCRDVATGLMRLTEHFRVCGIHSVCLNHPAGPRGETAAAPCKCTGGPMLLEEHAHGSRGGKLVGPSAVLWESLNELGLMVAGPPQKSSASTTAAPIIATKFKESTNTHTHTHHTQMHTHSIHHSTKKRITA